MKNDSYFCEKIITDIKFICDHMSGVLPEELQENEILLDSMMFRLIQISENSKHLSAEFKDENKYVPWFEIAGLRNRIVHDYGNVDLHIVYDTLSKDIPELYALLKSNGGDFLMNNA